MITVELRRQLSELQTESTLLRQIVSALVDDLGGEVSITIERLNATSAIDVQASGEGRDDEVTIRTLYPE